MTYRLSKASESKLEGVHPSLVRVVRKAITITPVDFRVTEGLRSFERQQELFKAGKSKTMNSRHLQGYAVDVVALPGNVVSWDMKHYQAIAGAFKQAAEELKIDRIKVGLKHVQQSPGRYGVKILRILSILSVTIKRFLRFRVSLHK